MKYMLLIHQGATPTPGSDEWESLSEDGKTLTTDGPFVEIKEAVGGCTSVRVRCRGRDGPGSGASSDACAPVR